MHSIAAFFRPFSSLELLFPSQRRMLMQLLVLGILGLVCPGPTQVFTLVVWSLLPFLLLLEATLVLGAMLLTLVVLSM